MADLIAEEVCRLKSDVPDYLETWGFSLLGWMGRRIGGWGQ
jgi:hypothetical protein